MPCCAVVQRESLPDPVLRGRVDVHSVFNFRATEGLVRSTADGIHHRDTRCDDCPLAARFACFQTLSGLLPGRDSSIKLDSTRTGFWVIARRHLGKVLPIFRNLTLPPFTPVEQVFFLALYIRFTPTSTAKLQRMSSPQYWRN